MAVLQGKYSPASPRSLSLPSPSRTLPLPPPCPEYGVGITRRCQISFLHFLIEPWRYNVL